MYIHGNAGSNCSSHSLVAVSLWILAASISVLSSRYLLVDLNYHFHSPDVGLNVKLIGAALHLCLVHLTFVAIFLASQRVAPTNIARHTTPRWFYATIEHTRERNLDGGWQCGLLEATCVAAALPLSMQSILHWKNLSTLGFMPIFAYLFHDILSLRQFRYPLKWMKYLEVWFCAVCCAVLLYDEYRLTSAGLICALLAMLLTGFAIGFVHPLDTSSIQACADHSSGPSLVKIVTVSFVITLGWCGKMEDTVQAAKHTLDIDPLVLGINIGSTMLAILLGHSFNVPVNIGGIFQISATIGFATIVGFASLHLATRSYVTELQLGAFYLTVICIIGAFQHARDADRVTLSGLLFPFHRLRPPPLSPDLIAPDNEGDSSQIELTEEATDRFSHAISIKQSSIVFSISIAACLVAILAWIGFIVGNFAGDANTFHLIPRLDLAYTPEHGFDVVISMYDEPIESIQSIMNDLSVVLPGSPPRLFLYTKSEDVELSILAALTNAFKVTKLPNYGREGETYLQHILLNWNSLAKHTLFVQADVHNPREIFHRIQDYYSPNKTGMLSLGFSGSSCSIENCGDRWGWYEGQAVLNDICQRVGEKPCTNTNLLLSYKGQFVVSAKRIRAVQREFYEYLRTAMTDPESWAHKEPYLQGRKDSLNAPQFGYTLERLWSLIMQCSTEEIAWKCPTLLSRTRRGGDLTDCQCLDP